MTLEKKESSEKPDEHSPSFTSRLNLEVFIANAPESKCDLTDGQYFHHSPASKTNVLLRQFLVSILKTFVEEKSLGVILSENFPIKLDESNWREPDLLFIPQDQMRFLQKNIFTGVPGLIIEILSPDSHFRDEVRKRAEYERIGAREYWIIDPDSHESSFFLRLEEEKYEEIQYKGNRIESISIPGLFLLKNWIWSDKKYPSILVIFQALGLLDK